MHFNLAKFLYRTVFAFGIFSLLSLLNIIFWPLKRVFGLVMVIIAFGLKTTFYPVTYIMHKIFYRPKPAKSYIKADAKPAVPPVAYNLLSQAQKPVTASVDTTSESFAPSVYFRKPRTSSALRERSEHQQIAFLKQFAGVVQY